MQKRVVITGAAGFIGSHLSERFIEDGWEVIGIDNFITSTSENLKELKKSDKFHFIEEDVVKVNPEEIARFEPALVMHMASPASPVDYFNMPIETMLVNSLGTKNMLDAARLSGARFFFASTSEVYGDPEVHPQPETYWGNVNPIGPRAVYDESKRYGEAMTMAYMRLHDMDVRIVRIFNTYGPRMRPNDGRVVSNFITQALKGEKLTIYGDGKQTRSFAYVSDTVEGIFRLATYDGLKGEVVNIGNPTEVPVIELAHLIMKLIPTAAGIQFLPPLEDDPKKRRPDISKAKKLLNWKPVVPLEEGLKKTIEYFKRILEKQPG